MVLVHNWNIVKCHKRLHVKENNVKACYEGTCKSPVNIYIQLIRRVFRFQAALEHEMVVMIATIYLLDL